MAKFKNILIKMKGGKSRTQRVKILASGKYKFVKNLSKRTSRTRKANPTRRRGVRRMARRKRRGGGGRNIQATAFKWIRIGALAGPGIAAGANAWKQGWGLDGVVDQVLQRYTGFSVKGSYPGFNGELFAQGWLPYLASVLATVGIPKIAAILRRL